MAYTDKSFIGSGRLWIGPVGGGEMREIGNCSDVQFAIESEKKSLRNSRGGGGEANAIERITAVSLSMTVNDFDADNLSMILYGTKTVVTAGSVTSEVQAGQDEGLIPTDFMIDTTQTVTVTGPSATPTYTAGTDYSVTAAGITVLAGGSIASGANVEISYTKQAINVVEALMNSGSEFELYMDGVNEAQSSAPVRVWVKRFKPSPTQDLSLISEDFAQFPINGSVLIYDAAAANTSKYFSIETE